MTAIPLVAQRTLVSLTAFTKKTVVAYTAEKATLYFNKESLLATYDAMKEGAWTRKFGAQNKAYADKAIEWLRAQQQPVQLTDKITDMSKPDHAMAWLIQKVLGARLLKNGEASVVRKSKSENQDAVEYTDNGGAYTFYFPGQDSGFFFGELGESSTGGPVSGDVAPGAAIGTENVMEVVFEESVEVEEVVMDDQKIFTVVEIMPEYPGGMEKWNEYAKKNLKYPKEVKQDKLTGTVYVSFVVQPDGSLSDTNVVRGLCPACDQEAVRLVKDSGKWKPGKQNGKTVSTRFVMPVKFAPAGEAKKN